MWALCKKEINSFFSSFTGYLVILFFVLINSLFLWVFPGDYNLLDAGYASLENLFVLSPWVFLFLVPAITMRLFSDEKRNGTLELLLTKPITDGNIVIAKYIAGFLLVLLALLPTLIYYVSVVMLGNPVGNIDTGGTWGSYIGLLFLAAVYTSVGVFASAITDNPLISFLIAVVLCFFLYLGFDSISQIPVLSSSASWLVNLGINEHYKSMSRGVIDSRDVVYFICASAAFLLATRTVLQSRKW
jgi:ABC-2 type transport system permease protein